eukprot:624594-Rhodomonas_salina.3
MSSIVLADADGAARAWAGGELAGVGRAAGGDQLPLARGPHRQAILPRRLGERAEGAQEQVCARGRARARARLPPPRDQATGLCAWLLWPAPCMMPRSFFSCVGYALSSRVCTHVQFLAAF